VTLGTYKMGTDLRQLGRVAALAFGWFYFATLCAILIALVLDGIVHPGVGVGLVADRQDPRPTSRYVSVDWVKFFSGPDPVQHHRRDGRRRRCSLPWCSRYCLGLSLAGHRAAGPGPSSISLEAIMAANVPIDAVDHRAVAARESSRSWLSYSRRRASPRVLGPREADRADVCRLLAIEIVIFCAMPEGDRRPAPAGVPPHLRNR